MNDVTGAADLSAGFRFERPSGDGVDAHGERVAIPETGDRSEAGSEELFFRCAPDRANHERCKVSAGIDGFRSRVRGSGTKGCVFDGALRIVCEIERDRSEAHERSVAGRAGVRASAVREILGGCAVLSEPPFVPLQRALRRAADIKEASGAAEVSLPVPEKVAPHLIVGVEPAALHETLGQAEGHRGVIRPLAGFQLEWATASHVRDGTEGIAGLELDGCSDGVAAGQADEGTEVAGGHSGDCSSSGRVKG